MEQGTPAVESPGATPVEAVLDLELLAELAGIGGAEAMEADADALEALAQEIREDRGDLPEDPR